MSDKTYTQNIEFYFKPVDHVLLEQTPNIPKVVVKNCNEAIEQANTPKAIKRGKY